MTTITTLRALDQRTDAITIVDLPKRLDVHVLGDLAATLAQIDLRSIREVSLDGSLVEHTDGAALGFLAAGQADFARYGVDLTVTNASLALRVVFELTDDRRLPSLRDDLLLHWEAA